MVQNRLRSILLATLLLLMTFSQIPSYQSPQADTDSELQLDPVDNRMHVVNSNPMSTIQDAVRFFGTVTNATINGHSSGTNSSIVTGQGGGDGNHWWKIPVVGELFYVNFTLNSWDDGSGGLGVPYSGLELVAYTNQRRCFERIINEYSPYSTNVCSSPQSGGFVYLRVSVQFDPLPWYGEVDWGESTANYSLEVEAYNPPEPEPQPDDPFPDGDLEGDSTISNPVLLNAGTTITGTLEPGSYPTDYVSLLQGLNTIHRVNVTLFHYDSSYTTQINPAGDLNDCNNYYSNDGDVYFEHMNCRVTGSNPLVQLSYYGWTGDGTNWSLRYSLNQITPAIEDEEYGDVYGSKMVAVNETVEGSVSAVWDLSDTYDFIIVHGHEMRVQIASDADIVVSIPPQEVCNSALGVSEIQIQAGMALELSCTAIATVDVFRLTILSPDVGLANYTLLSMAGDLRTDEVCCENDMGSGQDAPPIGMNGEHSIRLADGTSSGSFIHVTDYSDGYHLEIPPGEGRIVFVQGISVGVSGGGWTTEGDLRYRTYQNTGDMTMTEYISISPLDSQSGIRGGYITFNPAVYVPQEYSISLHEIELSESTYSEYAALYLPDNLGELDHLTVPAYQPTGNLSLWRIPVAETYSLGLALQFDPSMLLGISVTQASGLPVSITAYDEWQSERDHSVSQMVLSKGVEGGLNPDVTWSSISLTGLDGSELELTTGDPSLTTTTKESMVWFATPGRRFGALGTSLDEGLDQSDSWIITVERGTFYQITLQVDEELDAVLGGGGKVVSGCVNGEGIQNISISINRLGGMGGYTLSHDRGGDCSYQSIGFYGNQPAVASPGEFVFFTSQGQGLDLDVEDFSIFLFDKEGYRGRPLPIEFIDNLSWIRHMRVGIPSDVAEGSYEVRMSYDGHVVDRSSMYIQPYDDVFATPAFSVLGPGESPRWLVTVRSPAERSPGEWSFSIDETWMRNIDGIPRIFGEVELSTPTSDSGIGLVGTQLPWQPRPGARIFQTSTITTPADSANSIATSSQNTAAWTVGMIDLSITHAGGTSTPSLVQGQFPIYTSSIDNPANDIFYKIRAELNGNIPLAGVTGVANLFHSRHNSIIQSYPFETDGWGEASISIDHSILFPDHFTVELRVDEEWREWLGDVSFAAFEIESSASGGQDDPNRDEMSLELTAHLRRNILVAGETIIIDWSVESGQELNVLEWTLFDSIGRVLAADTTGQFGNTEGVLSIEIPESLDVSMRANIYLTARGIYGASDSVSMTIWNIADDTELIVNVQPDMARPGDTITVDLELGSEIDYLYWEWSLYEGGNEIATGNGWKASTKAGFTIELEQRQLQTLSLQIRVLDGTGTLHQEVRTIELRDIVELSVESDFSTNAGDPLALSWRITSSSIADGDKATSINIQLIQMGTGDVAHEISVLATGYSGELDLNIPTATRPGTYLLIVDVETAGGTQLTSQSLIDVHEPREKNYLLGMEIPPWSSIFSTLATAFLILNLAAIWTVLIKRRREKSEDEEASDLFDKDDEFAEEISTYEGLESFRDDESDQGSLTPSFVQDGAVHKDGFEWLEDPVGSERWWYRSEYGQEWTRSE